MSWYVNVSGRCLVDGDKSIPDGEKFEVQNGSYFLERKVAAGFCLLEALLIEKLILPIPCVPAPREEWSDEAKSLVLGKAQEEAVLFDRWDFL